LERPKRSKGKKEGEGGKRSCLLYLKEKLSVSLARGVSRFNLSVEVREEEELSGEGRKKKGVVMLIY